MEIRKSLIMAVAVVAAAAGCSKSVIEPSYPSEGKSLVFSSERPSLWAETSGTNSSANKTKTAWTGTELQWSEGDCIAVAYTCNDVWQNASGSAVSSETVGSKSAELYKSSRLSSGAATAKFSVPTRFTSTAEGVYQFYTLYPGTCAAADLSLAPSANVVVPALQTPAEASFDPDADILIGKSVQTFSTIPSEAISTDWKRVVAHAVITFEGLNGFAEGEKISKIILTANPEAEMVGAYSLDLTSGAASKASGNTRPNVLTIAGDNLSVTSSEGKYSTLAWASFLPCTLTSLDVEVTTDKAVYKRSISGISLQFKANAPHVFTVDMSSAIRTEVSGSATATIRDFAEQYIKLIDIWESTTGTINLLTGETPAEKGTANFEFNISNAHYIPATTKMTVCGTEYSTADVFELALRSYLLLRGYNGNNTAASGAGKIPSLSGGSMSTALPQTHSYKWGTMPYNECLSGVAVYLVLGNKTTGKHCRVKLDFLDNYAMRNVNFPMNNNKQIANMSSYDNNQLSGYYGKPSAMRALITYALFFEYLLDNNLEDATGIDATQIFRSDLLGNED